MLNKQKFSMATPALTQEYNPSSCRKLRKTLRLPPHREMRPVTLHWVQSNSLLPIKQECNLDLLDDTTESPPEIHHKSRRTLMSPQEC